MKRLHWEILFGVIFVAGGTYLAYNILSKSPGFWTAQNVWSVSLVACWAVVAGGYWHQGSIIHKARSATHVSFLLPCAVFTVQCILFVKGVYYHDYALIAGAIMVNSAVVFDLYQIWRYKR